MKRRDYRIQQLLAVEREYRVMAIAAGMLRDGLRADPSGLKVHGLKRPDFEQAVDRLDATYLIRLFAEFESGLREAWAKKYHQKTHPPTAQLLTAVTARCGISRSWHQAADEVRIYRNALVHEVDDTVAPVDIGSAAVRLKRYLSKLPAHW